MTTNKHAEISRPARYFCRESRDNNVNPRTFRFKVPSPFGNTHGATKFWTLLLVGVGLASPAYAEPAVISTSVEFVTGNLWLLVATAMVFVMHLGFATLETGLTQEKNSINILFKNMCIIAIGILTYAAIGFNLMYPGEEFAGGFLGLVRIRAANGCSRING